MVRSCLFVVLSSFQLSMVGCLAIPLPWFPSDPYREPLASLAKTESVTRKEIVKKWGAPWASAGENNLIYVADKTSSILIVGFYGGGGNAGPMTFRDFFVSFIFDDFGVLTQIDTYADTGNHNHCFDDGICFTKETRNVPLMPEHYDQEAKQFKETIDKCTVYMFRKPYSDGSTYKEYVDIQVAVKADSSFSSDTPYGTSVPGGYFRWELDAGKTYRLTTDFSAVSNYPFVANFSQPTRAPASTEFQCEPEELIYAALMIPKSKKKAVNWSYPEPETAQESIGRLRLLAGYYLPK